MSRISRFTPWNTSREQLQAMFVARQALLDDLIDRGIHAASTASRQHTLIVGQRGSGKTHLIALAYYHLKDLEADNRFQLVALPEEPWAITTYRDFLAAILEALDPGSGSGTADELEFQLEKRYADGGVIVVLVENLDQLFDQIEVDGQRKLRHFLQTSQSLLLLATTSSLDRSLTAQASPFYNFFTTIHLEPLTVEQALELVIRLAEDRGADDLVEALDEPLVTQRFNVVEHLAGGQTRLWVVFGQILTPEGIHQLADTLFDTFDDLTPYYQDRLRTLSPQQRRVVAELAAADHPLHVQDLAGRTGLAPRSVARTMSELRDLGWVRGVATPWNDLLDKRRSYYELSEPLTRLAFQVKQSWGEPIRLIVEFLSYWYDPSDTANWPDPDDPYLLDLMRQFSSNSTVRVVRQLSGLPQTESDLAMLGQIDDALAVLATGDAEPIMALPTMIRLALEQRWHDNSASISADWQVGWLRHFIHFCALLQTLQKPDVDMLWIARAEALVETAPSDAFMEVAETYWAFWLARAKRFAEAEAAIDQMDPHSERAILLRRFLANLYHPVEVV